MRMEDPDTFTMKWGTFSHFVTRNQLPDLHFAVERWKDGEWSALFPITWAGNPTCDPSGTSWAWGCIYYNITRSTFQKLIQGKDEIVYWQPYIGMHD
jgi:hypothetical protein